MQNALGFTTVYDNDNRQQASVSSSSGAVTLIANGMSEYACAIGSKLHEAALSGDLNAVAAALEGGDAVGRVNDAGATPLFLAALEGHREVVDELIRQGAVVDIWSAAAIGNTTEVALVFCTQTTRSPTGQRGLDISDTAAFCHDEPPYGVRPGVVAIRGRSSTWMPIATEYLRSKSPPKEAT